MASSTYSTLALTLLLIVHLTPETTASRRLNENNPPPSIHHTLPFAPAPLIQGYIPPHYRPGYRCPRLRRFIFPHFRCFKPTLP
ncbi:unnamed protein product [Arabis nemorensis]|uniref:Uncharacterized protein n=1 Tax=Arabis nemorensis TaxID=586526 RepID=A0A565AW41_9BRAS|nr:unnamed protein product [Arabis nemorensis]